MTVPATPMAAAVTSGLMAAAYARRPQSALVAAFSQRCCYFDVHHWPVSLASCVGAAGSRSGPVIRAGVLSELHRLVTPVSPGEPPGLIECSGWQQLPTVRHPPARLLFHQCV